MAVRTIYRVQCIGPCARYLSDVNANTDTTYWTARPSSALVFYDVRLAHQADIVALDEGLCPRCKARKAKGK